jgi:hypothetical protein
VGRKARWAGRTKTGRGNKEIKRRKVRRRRCADEAVWAKLGHAKELGWLGRNSWVKEKEKGGRCWAEREVGRGLG